MKIEKNKPRRGGVELPPHTKLLVVKLQSCSDEELIATLQGITVWKYGKCELYHWVDVLDRFDKILNEACRNDQTTTDATQCVFMCPSLQDAKFKEKVVSVLYFTALLVEHSYTRNIYNSTEHLCTLLASPDMDVVLAVLNLLYVFSKRSNFISRLPQKHRSHLNSCLEYLGETWGGKQNGFGLAQCCRDSKTDTFPASGMTVYFEYQPAEHQGTSSKTDLDLRPSSVTLENVDRVPDTIEEIMGRVTQDHKIPQIQQMQLLTRIRLARNFIDYKQRLKCVMARLHAISILVYSIAPMDVVDPLIYDGLVEELVEVLEIKDTNLMEIRAAVLRTLTAIIHLERDPRSPLGAIIEATGASTYHGFLPSLVRDCVASFTTVKGSVTDVGTDDFPLSFATALFSFLYHLATYEASGDALVGSGVMDSLIQVLEWKAFEPSNITLVTRAVRVIDLITNLDMSAFHSLGGWSKMLDRLELEVTQCRAEVPFVLPTTVLPAASSSAGPANTAAATSETTSTAASVSTGTSSATQDASSSSVASLDTPTSGVVAETSSGGTDVTTPPVVAMDTTEERSTSGSVPAPSHASSLPQTASKPCSSGVLYTCMPERAALIKSILNFLKKAIPEPTFSENMRTFVDSSLPQSLKHIVSNAEYYGPSIYLPATEVATVFIFHEPSQLTPLQDNGLPWVMLNSIINKQIPVTREVLSSLPNTLSALCLNARGLQVFIEADPFDHLFGVLINPEYLPAMRKKKGVDHTAGDTANNLGVAMDELMRHQPTLRSNVIRALINLLKKLCNMGQGVETGSTDSSTVNLTSQTTSPTVIPTGGDENMSSDSENEEEEGMEEQEEPAMNVDVKEGEEETAGGRENAAKTKNGKQSNPPLTEYVINVVHFVDSILSNNLTDDHIREFISQGGLSPLLRILSLPTLPLDFPTSSACVTITGACKSILNIGHSHSLVQEGITQLNALLTSLSPFLDSPEEAGASVLLEEIGDLANMSSTLQKPTATPLLRRLVAVNAFIQMFIHLCKSSHVGYNVDSRVLCVNEWSKPAGQQALSHLARLYRALVWEGFILLAVAAKEEPSNKEEVGSVPVISTSESASGNMEESVSRTETSGEQVSETVVSMDTSSVNTSAVPEQQNDGMDTSESDSKPTEVRSETPEPASKQSSTELRPSSILIQSLKQLTPLFTITSRVGRSLAELLSFLVKVSTSPLHRPHRRGAGFLIPHYQPPSEEAITVCSEVTNLLLDSLNWEVPMPELCLPAMQSPIRDWLFGGMTFKMYAVDFCELLLFDEHKQAYHLVLHCFEKKSVLDAYISTFEVAMDILDQLYDSEPKGPVHGSCVDFLESWLRLAEKLVDATSILESSHPLSVPPPSQANGKKLLFNPLFNPLAFVIQTQRAVFPCLKKLFQCRSLPILSHKVVELLLSTVRHVYCSERVIEAKLREYKSLQVPPTPPAPPVAPPTTSASNSANASSSSTAAVRDTTTEGAAQNSQAPPVAVPQPPRVNPHHLQQLFDMGFSRAQGEEALLACGDNLTAAMEWLLTHPAATGAATAEVSEEEQIMQAIALSLGENVTPEQKREEEKAAREKEEEEKKKREEEEVRRKGEEERRKLTPLDRAVLDDFSNCLMPSCLVVISNTPESVYRVCDLFTALMRRNNIEWRKMAIGKVRHQVRASVVQLSNEIEEGKSIASMYIPVIEITANLAHLLVLLMEELPYSCVEVVCEPQLLAGIVKMLRVTQAFVCASPDNFTPQWTAPLMLLLDSWEKNVLMSSYRWKPKENTQVVWQWLENVHGRWCSFSSDVALRIEQAYRNGDPLIRVVSGRHKHIIQFSSMLQINTETNAQRPVLRLEIPRKTEAGEGSAATPKANPDSKPEFTVLDLEQATTVIKCCTQLLGCPNQPADVLHANLRLCLRLSRQPELAAVFVQEGGPQALLSLTQKSGFRGFSSLAALLFRHCLEEGPLLKQAMEAVVRQMLNPANAPKEGRAAVASRELHYIMRKLGPAACRDPVLFKETACTVLRLSTAPPKPESYTTSLRVPSCNLKLASGLPKHEPVILNTAQSSLINLLIDHLCAETFFEDSITPEGAGGGGMGDSGGKVEEETGRRIRYGTVREMVTAAQRQRMRHGSYRRQVHGNVDLDDDVASVEMNIDAEPVSETVSRQASSTDQSVQRSSSEMDKKPLVSKAAILRLLAELVDSYPSCAKLITESSRKIRINGQPAKEMTVLAFIFDHLLLGNVNQANSAPPISKVARVFLQCLATIQYPLDAILVLVTEFKLAFNRALSLAETQLKHIRVRTLASLLSQILDAQNNSLHSRVPVNPSHFSRLLIRRGFISDLSRATHSLDLNSSHLVGTINNILKPLEVLTRIVNQVASSQRKTDAGGSSLAQTTTTTTSASQISGAARQTRPVPTTGSQTGETAQSNFSSHTTEDAQHRGPEGNTTTGAANLATSPSANVGQENDAAVDSSFLEATHESLIPLEEEEEDEGEREQRQEIITLAQELGRQHREELTATAPGDMDLQIVDNLLERESGGAGVHPDAIIDDVMVEGEGEVPTLHDSHDSSVSEGDLSGVESEGSEEDEEDGEELDDNFNSAGEEVEEDEFDETREEEGPVVETQAVGDHEMATSDFTDAESTQDEEEGEEEEEEESEGTEAEDEEETDYLDGDRDGGEETGSAVVDFVATAADAVEGEEEEEEEEEEEDEEDDEFALDLEYDYEVTEGDDGDVYLRTGHHRMVPPRFMDLDIPTGFPSVFSRAYPTHLSQHTSDFDPLTSSFSSSPTPAYTLPQFHPLLVRHADHPQQQVTARTNNSSATAAAVATNATAGGSNSDSTTALSFVNITPSAEAAAVAMQQVLTNISAASGGGEAGGRATADNSASGSQRTRGGPQAQSQQTDSSYESSSIQITQQRWEEESSALDGHAAHLTMAVIKEEIVENLLKIYEQESKPKDTAAKTSGPSEGVPEVHTSSLAVPHPSDQATPSSPRNAATVDQLRSSLRQVADALAQTVAAVRNTREQLQDPLGTGDETMAPTQDELTANEEEDDEEDEEQIQFAEDPEANLFLPLSPSLSLPPPPRPDHQVPSSSFLNTTAHETFHVSDILAGTSSTVTSVTTSTTLPLTTTHTVSSSSAGASTSSNSRASTTSSTVSSFSLPTPMFTQATSLAHAQATSTPTTTATNAASIVSSFDGSQESARATLERTDPQDPLYTFLSAYVGAPPPPIVSSVEAPLPVTSGVPQSQSVPLQPTQSTPAQPANVPHSVSSPRLPVFTQMQSSPESHTRPEPVPGEDLSILPSQPTVDLTAPPSDTYSRVTSPPSPSTAATTSSAHHPSTASSLSTSEATDIVSIAENIASQVTSFFQLNPLEMLEPYAPPGSLDHTASLASSLAQELSMTVSQLTPTTSSSSDGGQVTTFPYSTSATNVVPSNSLTLPQASSATLAGQSSPSPSDTLAPLISSLQMPTPPSVVGGGEERGTARVLQRGAEGSDGRRPTTDQTLSQAGENIVTEETGTASMIAGRPWPEVGQIFEQGVVGEGTLEPVVSSASGNESGGASSATATAAGGDERSQSSAMEEDSTAGTSSGVAASSSSATATNIPPTLRQLPDTIDQEVLAELPDHIRQEVLAQHAREQRARQARQEGFTTAISPEFLSALPPNIQEELLQQERAEQTRQQQQQGQTSGASALAASGPIDNISFFHNLAPELRRTILADVDDSIITHLPEEIASEARALRQERETRRRQILEQRHAVLERIFEQASNDPGAGYMQPPSWDPSGYRYAILNLSPQQIVEGHHHHHLGRLGGLYHHLSSGQGGSQWMGKGEQGSKQMLDQEALTCLLVLLFFDQNKLHNNRLHRIVKNLSQHMPTRAWIISSLLAILNKASPTTAHSLGVSHTCPLPPPLTPQQQNASSSGEQASSSTSSAVTTASTPVHHCTPPHWLNLNINAALGSHTHVFHFQQAVKVGSNPQIHIHPLASSQVCNNVLDLLVFLSRQFPSSFLPAELMPNDKSGSGNAASSSSKTGSASKEDTSRVTSNFWQILLRLDGASSRKGKGALKGFQFQETVPNSSAKELFSRAVIGQLMVLLQHSIIRESVSLTDKLLRVLSVASSPIPKTGLCRRATELLSGAPPNSSRGDTQAPRPGSASQSQVSATTVGAGGEAGVATGQSASNDDVFVTEEEVVEPSLLHIVISVLTSGLCSEDGLEDATQLLMNLSKCSVNTRESILFMLLDGIRTIGLTLCSQIAVVVEDLNKNWDRLKFTHRTANFPEEHQESVLLETSTSSATVAGTAASTSASTASNPVSQPGNVIPGVVLPSVTPEQPTLVDHSKDLHLPSMTPLTCKGSQQSFFLRMLKVVCQLRESAQAALLGAQKTDDSSTTPQPSSEAAAAGTNSRASGSISTAPSLPVVAEQSEGDSTANRDAVGTSSSATSPQGGEMEVATSSDKVDEVRSKESVMTHPFILDSLSMQLQLDQLWWTLSECLDMLAQTNDPHAVLILQPTVEAFFLVHANSAEEGKPPKKSRSSSSRSRLGQLPSLRGANENDPTSPGPRMDFSPIPSTPGLAKGEESYSHLPPDTARFLMFAEKHRTVLNQILRQCTIPLAEGPFAVLVNYTKILDFDIKRRYFRHELEMMDDGLRREDIVVHLRREHVFEDAFRELYRRSPEDFKGNLYIQFEGEEGQDAGGLLREFYIIIARDMFNPNYALFTTSPGDRVTYMPNPSSHVNPNHLNYFRFIGRMIAKAIYDNKLLDCYFTRSFYKHILGKAVHYTDMESEDYSFYQGMVYLLEHNMDELGDDLTFSIEIQEFGKTETKDLKENGQQVAVTEANKREYVQLACQMKMTESIKSQIKSFLEGFYEVIPKELISIFNEQELELLISGLPTIDIDDLKANSEYRNYQENSLQVQWFWRALRSFDQADRARFLQFVTGTSKVPLQGFAALEGMNGVQKFQIHRDDRSTDRLPCAHTCFNQLDLPPYETYDKLKEMLLLAVRECPEGFGFA